MRICLFATNDLLNDARVTRHALALGKLGHRVLVVCAKSSRTRFLDHHPFYVVRRCDYNRVMQALIRARESQRPTQNHLLRIFRTLQNSMIFLMRIVTINLTFVGASMDFRAQVYVSNDLDTLLAGVVAAGLSWRLVYDAHEMWPDMLMGMGYSPPQVTAFRILERILLRRVDAVITVNDFIAREFARRYGIRKPWVVLNASASIKQVPRHKPWRRIKKALYHGAYIRNRGLENLILACEFLRSDVQLLMRGFGEIEGQLREMGQSFSNCHFVKPVAQDQVVRSASDADIGIVQFLPINVNNYLVSPNKLFEYIQAGLPVVASNLPFLKRVIAGNKIGYLFDPRDPTDIARAINRATRSGDLRALRKRVLKIRKRYSWENQESKLQRIVCGTFS